MKMTQALSDLRVRVCEANLDLYNSGLIISTFGNVSEKLEHDGATFIAIKPSGVSYQKLRAQDIPILDTEGNALYGSLRPSSDTPTHLYLYKNLSDIAGITHTHSVHATAWAQSGRSIPILGTTHADYGYRAVPCTRDLSVESINGEYEKNTGEEIISYLKSIDYLDATMVLVKNHGPFTMGRSAIGSVENAIFLEEIAKMAYMTLQLNPQSIEISDHLIKKHFLRKHGPNKYYGQDN